MKTPEEYASCSSEAKVYYCWNYSLNKYTVVLFVLSFGAFFNSEIWFMEQRVCLTEVYDRLCIRMLGRPALIAVGDKQSGSVWLTKTQLHTHWKT